MTRADILRMAREAGHPCPQADEQFLIDFAALVVADAMVRGLSVPITVNTADLDPALLRDMLAKAPAMPLLPMPAEPTPEAIAAAVAAEREACARVCEGMDDNGALGDWPTPGSCADAIRARGAA